MPLYLTSFMSYSTFDLATDDEGIVNRYSILSTYFLAAFAMLYGTFVSSHSRP